MLHFSMYFQPLINFLAPLSKALFILYNIIVNMNSIPCILLLTVFLIVEAATSLVHSTSKDHFVINYTLVKRYLAIGSFYEAYKAQLMCLFTPAETKRES